jgi:hypothetical protein
MEMQTFEQWWNEIENFGLRAERFTTPDDAARAAWDQAMSVRAQADARPVTPDQKLNDWGRISKAAQTANMQYGQWMPERWLQLFVKAFNGDQQ